MAILQFPQPKLAEKTGEGVWRLTGRVILPEDGSLDRAAALLGEDYPALAAAEKVHGGPVQDPEWNLHLLVREVTHGGVIKLAQDPGAAYRLAGGLKAGEGELIPHA